MHGSTRGCQQLDWKEKDMENQSIDITDLACDWGCNAVKAEQKGNLLLILNAVPPFKPYGKGPKCSYCLVGMETSTPHNPFDHVKWSEYQYLTKREVDLSKSLFAQFRFFP